MNKMNRCSKCGRTEISYHDNTSSATNLPFGWCYITEKGCGVHDSDTVEFVYNYILCDKCRAEFRKHIKADKCENDLEAENEKYRKALIIISCWRQKDPIYSEDRLPNVIAEQALKAG